MSKVNIEVNGASLSVESGKSLLDNLLENGIFVPNLCNDPELEAYGGCGLCLVSIEGIPKAMRACVIKPTQGMKVETDTPEVIASRNVSLGLIAACHKGDCIAPCRRACPAHQDCQGYVGLIADGKYAQAIKLIKEDNPLPSSIGRVCPHPCEVACRRENVEGAVSICSLKRFAADFDESEYIPECKEKTGARVAVIGAGPSGLSAAYFLARQGVEVEIFEAMGKAGGMLRYGIPEYRLPDSVLDREIAAICALGIKINYNQKLGRDFTLAGLRDKFDAVYAAVGAWKSGTLGCENDNLPNVLGGIDFLRAVSVGSAPDIGESVAVVGGGNTAMDTVRTAVRLGAKKVCLLYRRTREEMPADKLEIEEAMEEGVEFLFLTAPVCVLENNGKAAGLRVQRMQLGEPDASGRRRPVPVEGAQEDMYFDTVIASIGQKVAPAGLEELEFTRWGTVKVNPETFATSVDGVFAGGDSVNDGPGIAVSAIAHGKNAARSIAAYLRGEKYKSDEPFYFEKSDEVSAQIGEVDYIERTPLNVAAPEMRKSNFSEVASTFTQEQAKKEASRCLECGCGSLYDCRLLPLMQEYKPLGVVAGSEDKCLAQDESNPFIVRDNNKCILCGLCVRVCKQFAGVEALGLRDRGFDTVVECAFSTPLADSVCITCGRCTAVCPTGALQDRRAFSKTPALPTSKENVKCGYCPRGCEFELYAFDGIVTKAIPAVRGESCSVGRYALTLATNSLWRGACGEKAEKLCAALAGDMKLFEGNKPSFKSIKDIEEFIK